MGSTLVMTLALMAVSADAEATYKKVPFVIPTPGVGPASTIPVGGGVIIIEDEEDEIFDGQAIEPLELHDEGCGCESGKCYHHWHSLWQLPWQRCSEPLPNYHRSSGDMPQHLPYLAEPKNYYYFRPYNVLHVKPQQEEVMQYGGDPKNPYDNRIFEKVYDRIRSEAVKK